MVVRNSTRSVWRTLARLWGLRNGYPIFERYGLGAKARSELRRAETIEKV